MDQEKVVAVIGLGYVGLPLAIEFGKRYETIGFDIDEARVRELSIGHDSTLEVSKEEFDASPRMRFTCNVDDIRGANHYIVTVPTPVDRHKRPDLKPLLTASKMLGGVVAKGDIIIYESTVYPGATEDDCIPIVEQASGLVFNKDFFAGYSPERINPGDREHRLTNIKKVTSGSTPEIAERVDGLYRTIISAGTHKASSIRVAEAAKVIENTQRDLNIALVNELALIFNRLGIDTLDVLEAAGTKWNFLPFRPGLVGGHCIGVDPYYLTHKAQEIGYTPEVILAGRRINDGMGAYVASQVVKLMLKRRLHIQGAKVLILGLTFKENCPDLRNTRVVDVVREFQDYGANVHVFDPWADASQAKHEYSISPVESPSEGVYDAIVLAVAHDKFSELSVADLRLWGTPDCVLYDIKGRLPKDQVDGRL